MKRKKTRNKVENNSKNLYILQTERATILKTKSVFRQKTEKHVFHREQHEFYNT